MGAQTKAMAEQAAQEQRAQEQAAQEQRARGGGPAPGSVVRVAGLLLVALLAVPLIAQSADGLSSALQAVVSGRDHGGDYIAFYAAGKLYGTSFDGSAYDLDKMRTAELAADPSIAGRPEWRTNQVDSFRNPPFYLPVVAYLAGFSLPVGFAISTALEAMLLGALVTLTASIVGARAGPEAAVAWVAVALAYAHTWQGFVYGQLPAYATGLAFLAGLVLWRRGWAFWSGLAFALLLLKFQYLVPVVLFLALRRDKKALLGTLTGCLALLVISLLAVGVDGFVAFVENTIQVSSAPDGLYFLNYFAMYTWRGLLESLLGSDQTYLILAGQVILIGLTYALAIWTWLAPIGGSAWRRDALLFALTLTLIVGSPHAHGQDLVVLLPGCALVAAHLWSRAREWPVALGSALLLLALFLILPQPWLMSGIANFGVLPLALLLVGAALAVRTSVVEWVARRWGASEGSGRLAAEQVARAESR